MNASTTDGVNLRYLLGVCLVATLGGLLFGYDTAVISGAIEFLTARFQLGPAMKGWSSSCVLIGCALGVLVAGPFSDRFGRRRALMVAAWLFFLSSLGTSLPRDVLTFIVFRFVGGLGIGIASMTTPMYIAEIAPARLRGRLVALNQLAIVTGIVLVYFVNYFIAQQGDLAWNENVGWRWMFASGIFPSVLFALLLLRIPESPRWLVEAGRVDEARDVLTHVTGSVAAAREVAGIQQALQQEKGGWRELFSRTLAVPLLLGLALAVLQQVTGINVFLYFGTSIFKSLGSSTGVDAGMLQQIIIGAANAVFTVIAIATVDRLGRKPLMVIGAVGMGVSLVSMGLVAQLGVGGNAWMLAFILLYIACFSLSVGPVTWVILAEIFPTAVRGRALGLATFGLWVADFLVTLTFPILDAPGSWFVRVFKHAFPFYMYAVFCVVLLVVLRFVPETKGRSLEEIERFWKKR